MCVSPRYFRVAAGILDDDAEYSQLSTGADVLVACPIALPTLSRPCTARISPSLSHWYSSPPLQIWSLHCGWLTGYWFSLLLVVAIPYYNTVMPTIYLRIRMYLPAFHSLPIAKSATDAHFLIWTAQTRLLASGSNMHKHTVFPSSHRRLGQSRTKFPVSISPGTCRIRTPADPDQIQPPLSKRNSTQTPDLRVLSVLQALSRRVRQRRFFR
ncbi:hypothetical protein C8R45DRAFT_188983 [Mycena sanguinolenta]|nr:hypothetical protein C8R45DRAFT_188983 [Mycena sanguinolenta]